MRRECVYCGDYLGTAPGPAEDTTHGACGECGDKAMRLIDEDMEKYNQWVTECLERKNAKINKT